METQLWVLTGLVSVLATVLTMVAKASLKQLVGRLDALVTAVGELTVQSSIHKTEIANETEKNNEQDQRLNELSKRVRQIEIKK